MYACMHACSFYFAMTESLPFSRYYAKKCVYEFCGHPEFERIAGKCLPKPQFVKLKEAMETLRLKVRYPQLINTIIIIINNC